MDIIRNRILPILESLGGWRYQEKEILTEVEICEGDYNFTERLNGRILQEGWKPFGSYETSGFAPERR